MGSLVIHPTMYTALVCLLGILGTTLGGARYTRDTEGCNQEELMVEVEQCTSMAYTTYTSAWAKGDDGTKADFYARKSCNYITETIEECSDLFKDCMDEEYTNSLKNIEDNIESWDPTKCPAVQRHNDRLNAAEAAKDTKDDTTPDVEKTAEENENAEKEKGAEDNNTAEQEQSTGEENQKPTASATSLAVSIFSTLGFALLVNFFFCFYYPSALCKQNKS